MVEQQPFKLWVPGSSPGALTILPLGFPVLVAHFPAESGRMQKCRSVEVLSEFAGDLHKKSAVGASGEPAPSVRSCFTPFTYKKLAARPQDE